MRRGASVFIFFALTLFATALRAQVGNSNPNGPAGDFSGGIVTTGCYYNIFTGNTKRQIGDLTVSSLGKYPLAFGRTANSRSVEAEDFGFGPAGGWRHSYAWEIDGSETFTDPSTRPSVYPVYFPDGRIIYFSGLPSDPYFQGPPGVPERFRPSHSIIRSPNGNTIPGAT